MSDTFDHDCDMLTTEQLEYIAERNSSVPENSEMQVPGIARVNLGPPRSMGKINTHGIRITFGKHSGDLVTRLPLSYIRWLMNEPGMAQYWKDVARSEFERRGDTMPKVELSGHAIDNASLRVRAIWHETALSKEEGLYSWLQRITLEALERGERLENGKIKYLGMKLVIEKGSEFPILKTIMQ